jgi:hypothetical protein
VAWALVGSFGGGTGLATGKQAMRQTLPLDVGQSSLGAWRRLVSSSRIVAAVGIGTVAVPGGGGGGGCDVTQA